ncbi:MAG: DUF402 domain-containing protein [Candidatus Bathyarchaeota archaeon]
MIRKFKVEIRGVYSTALTNLISKEFEIVRMSGKIMRRFHVDHVSQDFGDVSIVDREDKQGVVILGVFEAAEAVVDFLRKNLPDVVVREKAIKGWFGYGHFNVEFPYLSKKILDEERSKVIPTVNLHHRFRVFASNILDEAEKMLSMNSEKRCEVEGELKKLLKFNVGCEIEIQHVKVADEEDVKLKGVTIEVNNLLKVKRTIKGLGLYDGLNIKKEDGDYAITEIAEGSWITKHSYYSFDGKLKGEFYNINTPTELYPSKARYVDLEVDVVKVPGQKPKIIDKDKLTALVENRFINERLAKSALEKAEKLFKILQKSEELSILHDEVKPLALDFAD